MAYIHEIALKNAVKNLYMLGHSDKKHSAQSDIGGTALGGLSGKAWNQRGGQVTAPVAADAQKTLAGNKYGQDYAMSESTEGPEGGPRDVSAMEAAEKAQMMAQMNDLADQTRLGGQYSPNGLQLAHQNAQLDGQDRLRAHSALGRGMQLSVIQQAQEATPGYPGTYDGQPHGLPNGGGY